MVFQRAARLGAQKLCSLHQIIVHGGQKQNIRHGHIPAVLPDSALYVGDSEALAIGGNALGEAVSALGSWLNFLKLMVLPPF
jgi:hypothetical protein